VDKRQARAFEAFAAESGAELLRIATLLTSDPHIAEDVYQETLQRPRQNPRKPASSVAARASGTK
jgi:DNA-directed RNA polymerase specialized sigma24 family protein